MKLRVLMVTLITLALFMQIIPISDAQCLLPLVRAKPDARGGHSMAFDPHNGVAVIFGGTSFDGGIHSLGDTLTYSYATNQWAELVCTSSPPARANHAMVYCNQTNEILLYGGFGMTDTWSFDCSTQTWSQVVTATNPGVHHSHALAYDPRENVVILFGGFGDDRHETNETWKFDCATREWTELVPTTAPLARYGHVMVYDESINLIVLTAGNTAPEGHQNDTWTYNAMANEWTELTPTGNPDNLKWPSMTYDSVSQKCVLYGGQIGDYAVNHTWIYDAQLNTWSRRYPSEAPEERINTGLAFDPDNNVTILFGGIAVEGGVYDDTWIYSYESDLWTNMTIGSESTTTTSTPTIPNGPGFDPLLLVAIPLAIIIATAVVVVLVIRRRF